MSRADELFLSSLALDVARAGARRVRPKIRQGLGAGHGSRTLSRNVEAQLRVTARKRVVSRIYIDHYWAVYVHDGRGPFHKAGTGQSQYYVWYKNRQDDPRLKTSGGYPKRYRQVRRLSRKEFIAGKKAKKLIYVDKAAKRGIVHTGVKPSRFFSNGAGGGMRGFINNEARALVLSRWFTHVNRRLRDIRRIKGTITVRVG